MLRKIAWMIVMMYNYNKYMDVAGSLIFFFYFLEFYYSLNLLSPTSFTYISFTTVFTDVTFTDTSGVQQA